MELTPITYIAGGILAASAVLDYAYFAYYLQLKEYRFDRLRDFFSTESGRAVLFEYRVLWRTIFVAIVYSLLAGTLADVWILFVILAMEVAANLYRMQRIGLRRPKGTKKALLLVGGAFIVEMGFFVVLHQLNIILLVVAFRWLLICVFASFLHYPSLLAKKLYIAKAAKKMKSLSHVRVVGITGSYGKSSTKEFLSQILEKKFIVAKTPKNINTEIGIAKHILSTNFTDVDVYVVEMGAYRVGEIQAICNMVPPSIGILTAIAPQHLSLFGSMKNIQKAKFELLHALPKSGIAIINIDNKYCRELINTVQAQVRTFGSDEDYHPNVWIQDVKNIKNGIHFGLTSESGFHEVDLPIFGKHNVFNLIPAAMVAKQLGMKRGEIDAAVENIKAGQGSITRHTYGKATLLNDSYNSNPEGFKAALDLLNSFPSDKKRIVITRGMVELGESSQEIHEQIGGEISFVADELVIISKNSAQALAHGVVHKFNTEVHHMYDVAILLEYVKSQKQENVVILLENRLPSAIYKELGLTMYS